LVGWGMTNNDNNGCVLALGGPRLLLLLVARDLDCYEFIIIILWSLSVVRYRSIKNLEITTWRLLGLNLYFRRLE
jgi:hypothetical protein